MDAAILENARQQLRRKMLRELLAESAAGRGITLGRLVPIHALTPQVSGAKKHRTLAARGLMDFPLGFRALPAALHSGLVAQVGCSGCGVRVRGAGVAQGVVPCGS